MKRNWEFHPLSELVDECRGSASIQAAQKYELWSVPSFSAGVPEVMIGETIRSAKRSVQPDDVLLCKINPRINRVWVVGPKEGLPQVASTEWIVLRAKDSHSVLPEWLQLYLSSPRFREWIVSEISGATGSHTRAKPKEVLKQRVPVPPLSEQKRIVAILEEAFAGIDAAISNTEKNLANARELFESYASSVFSSAPSHWRKIALAEICSIKHGFAFRSEFFSDEGPYIVLTPGSFYESGGFRDQGKKTKFYVGDPPAEYILEKGDFLVAMTEQAVGLLGSSLEVPESGRFLHNQRLGLVEVRNGVGWRNDFFFHQFNTHKFRSAVQTSASGVKVRHTSPGKLGAIEVFVPPLSDQAEVGAKLNLLLSETRKLEDLEQQKLASLTELKQSLLQKAFSGELTEGAAEKEMDEAVA